MTNRNAQQVLTVPLAGDKAERIKMEKAYEEYFEGLTEGEEALSFAEFKEALS
ncbi:hypothetical protein [Citrobacter farmeri]|uniref:hypothetical protein n=1 Tax=Citrobacter farmeri TaxID=67824 RepID=UPI0018FF5039|nr:hypothetical protein [Citrobacter farmeri]MBJ9136992.1 hypothetical protein [Citrobacter farmeri]